MAKFIIGIVGVLTHLSLWANIHDENLFKRNLKSFHSSSYVKELFIQSNINTKNLTSTPTPNEKINFNNGQQLFDNISSEFPLNFYPNTLNYINLYQNSNQIVFLNYLNNSYKDTLKRILGNNNVPTEFHLLPSILSGFNPNSSNNLNGSGYWHLNYPQAIYYGLKIDKDVDERKDIYHSTIAASKYLNQLYKTFNDWEISLVAYVHGASFVKNLMNRYKVFSYESIYPYLNNDTKDIIYAFTAMVYAYHNNNSNGNKLELKLDTDTFFVAHKLRFSAIEKIASIKSKELSFYNSTLNGAYFPENYDAVFPKSKMDKFYQLCDSIYYYQDSVLLRPKEPTPTKQTAELNANATEYIVKSGDVLGIIAERFNVSVNEIKQWNNLSSNRIDIGQKLYLNADYKNQVPKQPKTITPKKNQPVKDTGNLNDYITYTVKNGDNLWIIAKKYPGISAQNIMDLNGIDANLKIGQVLKIKRK